jgi:hypothetical protein
MASGAPIVVSDNSSLREIMELPRARFDADKPDDIARVITDALSDDSFYAELRTYSGRRAADFSWSRTAAATANAYESLASKYSTRIRPDRRRPAIAICGRVSDEAPDIARIARKLVEGYDATVDVVVRPGAEGVDIGLSARTINAAKFRAKEAVSPYDAVLYVIDGSEFDGYLVEPIRARGGLVWLRGISLLPMYREYYRGQSFDLQNLPKELWQWTERYPIPHESLLLRDEVTQQRDSLYLLGEVASRATQIIVGSEVEREIVMLESQAKTPVTLVPRSTWDDDDVLDEVSRLLAEPSRELSLV